MTIFCFLRVSVFTMGDFPDGNRGCHASHRGSCAVPARPLRGSGFPSHCRNVNGRLAATVPVTPHLARRILRFLHPGKLTPGCGVITAKAVMLFSSSLRCGGPPALCASMPFHGIIASEAKYRLRECRMEYY